MIRYFLIVGVVLIWGIVVYKIVKAQDRDGYQHSAFVSNQTREAMPIDTFALNVDYPDPFLDGFEKDSLIIADERISSVQPKPQLQPAEEAKLDLSFIKYNGLISNPLKKTKVAIVRLNGKEMLIRENEEIGDVIFTKFDKYSLTIKWKGKKHVIHVTE